MSSHSAYVSESVSGFTDLVSCRVGLQPVLDAINRIPTPFSRDVTDSDLSETEKSVTELCLSLLELQMAGFPVSLPRKVVSLLSSPSSLADLWTDLLAPLNDASFSWSLNEAERWRHSTRISRSTDLKTLEAPFSDQLDFALGDSDRKFLRKFQPPVGKFPTGSTDVSQIFDDTLLYAALLKEVLISGQGVDVRSMHKSRTGSAAFRACKGRRLSAKVLEKLVGFVASSAASGVSAEEADVVVRSLFQ